MTLVPDYIKNLKPYVPGRTIEEIQEQYSLSKVYKLASNENPRGISPLAEKAIIKAIKNSHRYPDIDAFELRRKLAEKFDVKIDNVAIGNGSEGIIAIILRSFLCDNDEIISSEKTFIGFKILAEGTGKKLIEVPLIEGKYKFDLMAIKDRINENTKIIYLCNPNNPTGTIFKKKEFDEFMKYVPERVIVILDEAYFEYVQGYMEYPDSMLYRYDNVITLRTFSKAYGMAGIRIGYGFAHEDLIQNIMKVKLPFEPSMLAQAGAVAALDDEKFIADSIWLNLEGYEFLCEHFEKLNLKWVNSYANFIMVDFESEDNVNYINEELLKTGIIVRPLKAFGLPHCIRFTIGLMEENKVLVDALKKIINKEVSCLIK